MAGRGLSFLSQDGRRPHRARRRGPRMDRGSRPKWSEGSRSGHSPCEERRPSTLNVGSGFRTTNVERTLLDLFSVLPHRGAELALEDALRRRLTTLDRLWALYREVGGPGTQRVGWATQVDPGARPSRWVAGSRMEASLIRILRSLPGPPAATQHEVCVGDDRFRIDFAYPDVQLGIEAHSLRWHMGQERRQYDLVRDRRLKGVGWTMLYYSWDDIHLRSDDLRSEILDIRASLSSER